MSFERRQMMLMLRRRYILLPIVLGLWFVSACDDPFEHSRCKWSIIFSRVPSPDQLLRAEVQGWSCKEEADKITMMQVEVGRTNDFGSSGTVFSTGGKYSIKTSWLGPRQLLIECDGKPPNVENKKEDHWKEVKISYNKC